MVQFASRTTTVLFVRLAATTEATTATPRRATAAAKTTATAAAKATTTAAAEATATTTTARTKAATTTATTAATATTCTASTTSCRTSLFPTLYDRLGLRKEALNRKHTVFRNVHCVFYLERRRNDTRLRLHREVHFVYWAKNFVDLSDL